MFLADSGSALVQGWTPLMPCKRMRWQIQKQECTCGSMAVRGPCKSSWKAAFLEDGKYTTLEWGHQVEPGVLRVLKGRPCSVALPTLFSVFSMHPIILYVSYRHSLSFLYMPTMRPVLSITESSNMCVNLTKTESFCIIMIKMVSHLYT